MDPRPLLYQCAWQQVRCLLINQQCNAHRLLQVLDMAAFAQYSDDDENDYAGHHHHPKQHSHHHHQQHQQQHGAAAAAAAPAAAAPAAHHRSAAASASAAPAAMASPSRGGSGSGSGAPTTAPISAAPTSTTTTTEGSSEEFAAWRASIEAVLSELSAAISSKAATSVLCAAAGRLVGLVEEVRRREHSSAWLNSACSAGSGFRDAGGVALTLREAVSEHVFRLMDSGSAELLMKVGGEARGRGGGGGLHS